MNEPIPDLGMIFQLIDEPENTGPIVLDPRKVLAREDVDDLVRSPIRNSGMLPDPCRIALRKLILTAASAMIAALWEDPNS